MKKAVVFIIILISCGPSRTVKYKRYANYKEASINSEVKMVVQNGHSSSVNQLVYSRNGKLLASGSWDKTIKIWSAEDGVLLRTLRGFKGAVGQILFSPDDEYIVSLDKRLNYIRIWRVQDGALVKKLYPRNIMYGITFSPDGNFLIAGGKNIVIWNFKTKQKMKETKNTNKRITSISYSPNGDYLVSSFYEKNTIEIRNTNNFKVEKVLKGHKRRVTQLVFSPDSNFLASGADDKTTILWNTQNWKKLKQFKNPNRVKSVHFSKNSQYLVASSPMMNKTNCINIWKVPSGKLIRSFHSRDKKMYFTNANYAVFHPNSRILTAACDRTIIFWQIDNGLVTRVIRPNKNSVHQVVFDSTGQFVFNSTEKNITMRSVKDAAILKKFIHPNYSGKFALSHDDKYIASETMGKTGMNVIYIWRVADGKNIKIISEDLIDVQSLQFSPNGKYLTACDGHSQVYVWLTLDWSLHTSFYGHKYYVRSVSFSKDSKYIISGADDQKVKVWDVVNRQEVWSKKTDIRLKSAAFHPKQDIAATAGENDNLIQFWQAQTGKKLYALRYGKLRTYRVRTYGKKGFKTIKKGNTEGISVLVFSKDGKYLASAEREDYTIKIWRLSDRKMIQSLDGHTNIVNSLAFSPDGKYLVSGSSDTSLKIWNLQNNNYLSLLSLGDNWVVYNKEGYFDSSKNGGRLVAMVKGLKAFGLDQFALKNNRPDLLLKQIGLAGQEQVDHYYFQYLKRLKKAGISVEDLDGELHVPQAQIINKSINGNMMKIKFKIKDSKYSLKKYNIYVNDIPLFGAYGKNISGDEFEKNESIELSSGLNKIEVTGFNEKGGEAYRALTFAENNKPIKGNLYFIGFGVSKYKNQKLNLKYAHQDVKDLEKVFKKMQGKQFKKVTTKTFLNEKVNIKSIGKAKTILSKAGVEDTIVLFIAGHGVHDSDKAGTYYYLTYNANLNDLKNTASNFEEIESLLQGVKPRNKLFLMDTCESGEVEEDVKKTYFAFAKSKRMKARTTRGLKIVGREKSSAPKRKYLYDKNRYIYNDLFRRSGAIVFSSSKGGEFSYESDRIKNGYFTEEILKALKGKADKNRDGKISVRELREYVIKAVPNQTQNKQHPTVDRDNLFVKFNFTKVR